MSQFLTVTRESRKSPAPSAAALSPAVTGACVADLGAAADEDEDDDDDDEEEEEETGNGLGIVGAGIVVGLPGVVMMMLRDSLKMCSEKKEVGMRKHKIWFNLFLERKPCQRVLGVVSIFPENCKMQGTQQTVLGVRIASVPGFACTTKQHKSKGTGKRGL